MVLPILGAVLGGVVSAAGASSAAKTQANAAQSAADAQLTATRESNDLLREFRAEDIARFQPYSDSGTNALAAMNYELGLGDAPDGYSGFTATPGYEYRRDQGLDAVQNTVAARQGLLSGAALKGAEQFGQDYASSEYGNYLSNLGNMASNGQNAAGMQASTSQGYGTQMGSNIISGGDATAQGYMNIGNANAAGTIGVTNSFNNALTQGIGAWQQQNMLNAFS